MTIDSWISTSSTWVRKLRSIIKIVRQHVRLHHLLLVAVFLLSGASFWLAYEVRFDFNVPTFFRPAVSSCSRT